MSLERVIAEQQAKIDSLTKQVESGHETLATMWTKHEELFHAFARLIDARVPKFHPDVDVKEFKEFQQARHECRMQMLNAGFCMTCYNFVCECEGQYD